jgi:hypothetical protein
MEVQNGYKLKEIQQEEAEEERNLVQLWLQRPFCKRML